MSSEDGDGLSAERVALRSGASFTFRPLRISDGDALAEFYDAIPESDSFYYPVPSTRDAVAAKAKSASDPRLVCLVAEDDCQSIAGYAWYKWTKDTDRASTFGICVRPGHQGTGLGRALMSRICGIACEIGPPVVSLTVQKANARAFGLYQSMGFEVIREQLRGDGEPEYYMELRVRPTE